MTEKDLVQEALQQMKNLEDVVQENAKGILGATMAQEISELVKESLSKEAKTKQLNEQLSHWGISLDNFYIEDEAKRHILTALTSDSVTGVYIDEENGLCINYD